MESARPDQRRAAGLRTRARLMDAALDLIAERGEERVTLRELTGAADADVAAVSYHFGSLESLCDAAIEDALERYLDAQQEALSDACAELGRSRSRRDADRRAQRYRSPAGMGPSWPQVRSDSR